MNRLALAATLLAVSLGSGCAGHRHGQGHEHHRAQAMGPMAAKAAAPAPVRISQSLPELATGYKKVAAPAQARLYFIGLNNGAVVSSPLTVRFGLAGMGVAPAGVAQEGTGHHHLLVNVDDVDANAPLPATDQVRHFGAGQTEVTLELAPGRHTLQLLLGDQNHIPHHPPVISERITVTVR